MNAFSIMKIVLMFAPFSHRFAFCLLVGNLAVCQPFAIWGQEIDESSATTEVAPASEPTSGPSVGAEVAPLSPISAPPSVERGGDMPRVKDGEAVSAPAASVDRMQPSLGNEKLRFNFSSTPWKDVLLWLSDEADLSLKADRFPSGTLSFVDPSRQYTVAEALDQINRQLLDRGFALVRRGRLLMLIDLESPLAGKYIENIAEVVSPDLLDERGESDIVKCIFPLGSMTADAADNELRQMLGPGMPMTVLASARQVVITDTVARLKAIRNVLQETTSVGMDVTELKLQHRGADEILVLARPLLGLQVDSNSNESIRIAIDPFGDRLFVAGEPSTVALLQRIVEKADQPLDLGEGMTQEIQLPELRTYPITLADPTTVYDVMSTLLAGLPDTRMSLDPGSNNLIVFARPETHQIVQTSLDRLEGKGVQVDTIQLRRLDPSAALLTINKFFGGSDGKPGSGPIVDGDPVTRRLWIRGTAEQIRQTQELIERLEGVDTLGSLGDRIRVLPYTGQNAIDLLEQAEMMWNVSGRTNRIRMMTPATGSNSGSRMPERKIRRPDAEPNRPAGEELQDANEASLNRVRVSSTRLVMQQTGDGLLPERQQDRAGDQAATAAGQPQGRSDWSPEQAEIVVTMTAQGMVVASDDPDALRDFEELMRTLSEQTTMNTQQPTVFWLKYVKASVAGTMVTQVLGGESSGGGGGGGGGLLDELGGGMGMLGGLLGFGGGGGSGGGAGPILTATGSVSIVPDDRLNALFVQANVMDMETIELILEVIDRQESPEEVQTIARPRLIPVIYNQASDVATIVKGVFVDRIAGESGRGGGGGSQPRPEEFVAALRAAAGGGGRGSRGGGQGQAEKSEPQKIAIAVDARSNTLIVTATPQDFAEVQMLVEQIDQAGAEAEETTSVIALNGTVNPSVVQKALESVLGRPVPTATSSSSTEQRSTGSGATSSSSSSSAASQGDVQRRIEFFRALQGASGGGAPPASGRGGFGGGAPPSAAGGGGRSSGGTRSGGGRGR